MRRRTLLALSAATLLSGLLPLAGSRPALGQSSPSPAKKVVFTIGTVNDADSLNPFVGVEVPDYFVWSVTYDLLVNFGQKDLSPSPGLATSWETSADGLTWTFHIRDDSMWQDGVPVTANDVAFTYNRWIKDYPYTSYLQGVESVTATDDHTVVIKTAKPTLKMLSIYLYILPEHIWKDIDKKAATTFENVPSIGNGPFKLVEWQKGQFIRLEKNPGYWGGDAHVDEIVYRVFNNEEAVVEALKSGEIDYAEGIQSNLYNSLKDIPNITIHAGVVNEFEELAMNTGSALYPATANYTPHGDGHPALNDVRVRQAIAMAIDRQTLVDKVLLGYGTVASTIVTPVTAFYHLEPSGSDVLPYDVAAANALLDQAGYLDTSGDGVREMPGGGKALRFRYDVRSEDPNTVKASQFITGYLEQIGIATDVQAVGDNKLTDLIDAGNYDFFAWDWYPDPDPDTILSYFTCDQRPPNGTDYGNNDSHYCNPDYDALYLQQQTLLDPDQRAQVVKQMELMYYRDAAYVVLYYQNNLTAYRSDRFTGFLPQPDPDGDLMVDGFSNYSAISVLPPSEVTPSPGSSSTPGSGGTTAAAGGSSATTRGLSGWIWVAVLGGAVVLIGGFVALRRRKGQGERE